jgi:hypothetical protein
MGMSKQEVLVTPYGEMMDMLACSAIDAGGKQKGSHLTQSEMFFDVI